MIMRGVNILLAVLAIVGSATNSFAAGRMRLAQTSTTTNCLMGCNAQYAMCQSSCLVPGTPPTGAATTGSGSSAVIPIAANLLVTSPGGGVFNVSGTQYPGPQTLTGTYTLTFSGAGTVLLTAPSAENYVIYVLGTSGCTGANPVCAIQNFLLMDEDKTNPNASIIFAQD